MRLPPIISILVMITAKVIHAKPVITSLDVDKGTKPAGLMADARKQMRRLGSAQDSTKMAEYLHVKDRGKRKLIDTSFQLDDYLSKERPNRQGTNKSRSLEDNERANASPYQHIEPTSTSTLKEARKSVPPVKQSTTRTPEKSKGNRMQKGSIRYIQAQKKFIFDDLWSKQKLSEEKDPIALADKVVAMRYQPGMDSAAAGIHAGRLVRAKGNEQFESAYFTRMYKMSNALCNEKGRMQKDPYLSSIDGKEKERMAFVDAKKTLDKEKKKRFTRSKDAGPIAGREEAVTSINAIGKEIINHLKAKDLDFYTMDLKKLEQEIRDLRIPQRMLPAQFSRSLFRFIQYERDERDVDMNIMRQTRRSLR